IKKFLMLYYRESLEEAQIRITKYQRKNEFQKKKKNLRDKLKQNMNNNVNPFRQRIAELSSLRFLLNSDEIDSQIVTIQNNMDSIKSVILEEHEIAYTK